MIQSTLVFRSFRNLQAQNLQVRELNERDWGNVIIPNYRESGAT
jgi:hypothetical protein